MIWFEKYKGDINGHGRIEKTCWKMCLSAIVIDSVCKINKDYYGSTQIGDKRN